MSLRAFIAESLLGLGSIGVVLMGMALLLDGRLPDSTGATHEPSQQVVSAIRWVSPIASERP